MVQSSCPRASLGAGGVTLLGLPATSQTRRQSYARSSELGVVVGGCFQPYGRPSVFVNAPIQHGPQISLLSR